MFRPFAGCASLITTGLPSPLVLPSSTGSTTSESDVGTKCGMFHIDKIGDEYFTFLDECDNPKACTVILRGPSKDILNEIERNLQDAMSVARNVVFNPLLVPGGGATEMAISVGLQTRSRNVGVETGPFIAVADAMEVIPRTLAQNSGGNAIRVLTELKAKHAWGINGEAGKIVDMKEYGLYESASVKIQDCYRGYLERKRTRRCWGPSRGVGRVCSSIVSVTSILGRVILCAAFKTGHAQGIEPI